MSESPESAEIIDGLLRDAEQALAQDMTAKAVALYRGILAVDPDHVVALRQLGAIEVNRGGADVALELFRHAIGLDPTDPDLYHGVATALRLKGLIDQAILATEAALTADPAHAPSMFDRAMLLEQRGDLAQAAEMYRRLAAQHGNHAEAIFNRGVVLFRQDKFHAAERWFHEAGRLNSFDPRPLMNLALIYRAWNLVPSAVACLEHALTLAPDNAEVHWNLANALLAAGDFRRGFAEYEWRFRRRGKAEPGRGLTRWQGEDLGGRTILLSAEQGIGDVIQFVRFAGAVAARGGRVMVECHPGVERVIATAPAVSRVVTLGRRVGDAEVYAPLLSLPHLLGTTLDTVPAAVPYLSVPAGAVAPSLPAAGLRVGLVWRGNPRHENDRWRSVPLDLLAPLRDVAGVQLFSLQAGEAAAEAQADGWAGRLTDLGSHFTDFAATAAAIAALDLVISVDTAVAHLAGAMGKAVWLLIPVGNDWRWLQNRADSPWYPTLRLFRQHHNRNWAPAIVALTAALTQAAQG